MTDDTPATATELANRIYDLTAVNSDDPASGYEQSADAMWKAALMAFNYVAREVGATGFQASWAALKFYGEAMNVDGPFTIMQVHDALYPQYDLPGRLQRFLDEQAGWLAEQATEKLAEYEAKPTLTYTDDDGNEVTSSTVAPRVVEHWRRLAGVHQ